MSEAENSTPNRLIEACIRVICAARAPRDVTVREIARASGTSVSTLYHHYVSLDDLIAAAGLRLYAQINHERMSALQDAVERARPAPAPLREVLAALIGPPVRWSMDPARPYAVFRHINARLDEGDSPARLGHLIDRIDQHRAFIRCLRRSAPWFDEVEIGWRVNAALGIRSQVLRQPRRTRLLTQNRLDLSDPEAVIDLMLDVIEPMFARTTRLQARSRPAGPDHHGPVRIAGDTTGPDALHGNR